MIVVPAQFPTLASVGYIYCEHPRTLVNASGVLEQALQTCADCGARDGKGGSLHFPRLDVTLV